MHVQRGNVWGKILTNVGVKQGEVSSSLLFDGPASDAITAPIVAKSHDFFGIHDDLTAVDKNPAVLLDQLLDIEAAWLAIGLVINRDKTELICREEPTYAIVDKCNRLGIKLIRPTSGVRILGLFLGSKSFIANALHQKLLESLQALEVALQTASIHPRITLALIRFCIVPKLLFRFKVQHIADSLPIALQFDEALNWTVRQALSLPATVDDDVMNSSFGLNLPVYASLLEKLTKPRIAPPTAATATTGDLGRTDPQHLTTRRGTRLDPVILEANPADATVLRKHATLSERLSSSAAATTFLNPIAPNTLSACDFLFWIHTRMLCPISTASRCHCGAAVTVDHLLSCTSLRGVTATFRHNLITSSISSFLNTCGCVTSLEPRFYSYSDGSQRRPDITVHVFPVPIVTDVTVVQDTEAAVTAKIDKHGAAATARGHVFIPFVISKWGELHPTCHTFIAKCLAHLDPSTRHILGLKLQKRVADAFVEGSSAIVRNFFANPPAGFLS